MKLLSAVILCGIVCMPLDNCASLGTKTKVAAPEALPRMKTVAVWPIAALATTANVDEWAPGHADSLLKSDKDSREAAEEVSRDAERELLLCLKRAQLFQIIRPDSIATAARLLDSNFTRWSIAPWQTYANQISADAFMLANVHFGRESGGVNSYVTLKLFEKAADAPVVTISFNTKWGKSYLWPQPSGVTLSDAMEGAVKALSKEFQKAQAKLAKR